MSTQRYTAADLKAVVGDLGFCFPANNTAFFKWLNLAEERLSAYGRWWGSIQEVEFCVRDCLLVWPREIDTIEKLSLPNCTGNLDLHNAWYAYSRAWATIGACNACWGSPVLGWGSGPCGPLGAHDLARSPCSFDTTLASGHKLKLYPTHSSDAGKTVTIQGYDSNGVWVRTNPTGSLVIDGEEVTLALPSVSTSTVWSVGAPVALQKQSTNYRVLLYDLDLATMQERLLGIYQPGETNPAYRTTKIPALADLSRLSSSSCCVSTCGYVNVRGLAKLAHVPLAGDGDFLLYRNLVAYREAIRAEQRWSEGNLAAGNFHFFGQVAPKQARASNQATLSKGGAIPMLRAELRSMTADLTTIETHYEVNDRLQWTLAGYR